MLTKRVRAKSVRGPTVGSVTSRAIAGRSTSTVGEADCFPTYRTLTASPTATAEPNMLDSEKAIELEGTIMMVLPGTMFRVALANDHLVLAHISGKMRKRFIRLTIGDRVRMEMSPYDTAKARIVYRL